MRRALIAFPLRGFPEINRADPILLALLAQSAVDVLDETLLVFDQAISGRDAAAKQKVAEALAERARGGLSSSDGQRFPQHARQNWTRKSFLTATFPSSHGVGSCYDDVGEDGEDAWTARTRRG